MMISQTRGYLNPRFFHCLLVLLLGLLIFNNAHSQGIDSDLILQLGFKNDLSEDIGNNLVTLNGTADFGEDRAGNPSCALHFPGTNDDYLQITSTPDIALTGNDPFSVSVWFKTFAVNSPFQIIFQKGPTPTSGFEVALYDGNTPLTGDITSGYGLWDNVWNQDPNMWNDQNWHHLTVVKNDQNQVFLYRDGILRNSDLSDNYNIGDNALDYFIGKNFDGLIDDLRVYDKALNQMEVEQLYLLDVDCLSPNPGLEACVEFVEMPGGTSFGSNTGQSPGFEIETIGTEVTVTLEEYLSANNSIEFDNFTYLNTQPQKMAIFINTKYDLTNVPGTVTSFSFKYFFGSEMNFAVNGEALTYVNEISDLPVTLPSGATVSAESIAGGLESIITITDIDLQSVTFGGVELAFDNVCYEYLPNAICEVSSLSAHLNCEETELTVDFEVDNPGNDYFDLFINGSPYGFYLLADLPLTLAVQPGLQVNYLKVCINDNPNCCIDIDVLPDCPDCGFEGIVVEAHPCTPNGIFYVDLDFTPINPASDSFIVFGNGIVYGTYAYSDLFITLGPFAGDGSSIYEFGIKDQQNPDCSFWTEINALDCSSPSCNITNVVAEASDCDTDGFFTIDIDLEIQNPGGQGFMVVGDGVFYGLFDYADLPITLGPFEGDPNVDWQFNIFDIDNPMCIGFVEIGPIDCSPECPLVGVYPIAVECYNDSFWILTEIEFLNPPANSSNGYTLTVLGVDYGPFVYGAIPQLIGPFPTNIAATIEVIATDITFPNCSVAAMIPDPPNCPLDCEIGALEVFNIECTSTSTYALSLNFDYNNPGADYFLLWTNGQFYGEFFLSALPIRISDFPISGTPWESLKVCIGQTGNCCATTEFQALDCNPDCALTDMTAIPTDCNPNGQFWVDIDFDAQNTTSDSFTVLGNGVNYGNFAYLDLPIRLGPFPGDNQTAWEFIAKDLNNFDCNTFAEIGIINCNGNCEIYDLVVDPLQCTGVNQYSLVLNFLYQNPGNDFFEISTLSGVSLGIYALADLPVTIDNFPASGNANDLLIVCIKENPNCCAEVEFDALDCNAQDCELSNMTIVPSDCNPNGQFWAKIDFEYQNTLSDSFTLQGNGISYGSLAYSDLPVQIGPLPGDGTTVWEFFACDTNGPNCCVFQEIDPYDCNTDCEITGLEVFDIECNGEDFYALSINFSVTNPGSDFFKVWINGVAEIFLLSDLPIRISQVPISGDPIETIRVCIDSPVACCASVEFQALDCNNDCSITDLHANWEGCNPNGTSNVYINFNYTNPNNDFFDVLYDNQVIGTYLLSDLPLTISNFPDVNHNQNFDELTVCINDHPNCCKSVLFDILDCDGSNTCIDFEDFDPNFVRIGMDIVPGDFIAESSDVRITVGECYQTSGSSTMEIRNEDINFCGPFSPADQFMFLQQAGIALDFRNYNPLPSSLSFEFCGEGYLNINNTDSVFYGPFDTLIVISPNLSVELEYLAPGNNGGQATITGVLEDLTICGLETFIDNICFNSTPTPPNNDCVEFEELQDGFNYNANNHDPLLLESNGVSVTLSNPGDVTATSIPIWTSFNAASGLHLFLNGSLKFDFTNIGDPTEFVSFDYSGGVDNNSIVVNGGNPFEFSFSTPDTVLFIAPGVTLHFNRDATNTLEGNVSLFGEVETMTLTGGELAIDNVCYYTAIQSAQVWPGDANADNISNHCDLLNVGLAYGEEGPDRNSQSIDWQGFTANDWIDYFANGDTNFKHADCNGDGRVDLEDVAVIETNYGLEHGPVAPVVSIPGTSDDPPFYADLESLGVMAPGQIIDVPIILGSFDRPVEAIYGIAFTLEFDPDLIKPNSIEVVVKESWLGTPMQDLLSIDRSHANEGRIEIAISRIDQNNVDGFGPIAGFIGVIDDIVAKQVKTSIDIKHIKAHDFSENPVILFAPESPGIISTDLEENKDIDGLLVYPIPTDNELFIHNYNREDIRLITVYNTLGQQLTQLRYPKQKTSIDVSTWPSGIYYIDIKLPDVVITRKFKVTRL